MLEQEKIVVVYGEETFWPTRSSGFTVGPFTYTTVIQAGETPTDAFQRAHKLLHGLADKMFLVKRNAYFERLGTAVKRKES